MKYEGVWAVRQDGGRSTYWSAAAGSFVMDLENATEFTSRSAAEDAARGRGIVEDRSWVLLGHRMYVGGETMYFRGTCKGVGGSLSLERATHFTEIGAMSNAVPRLRGDRGFEPIHVAHAPELAEVADHRTEEGQLVDSGKMIIALDFDDGLKTYRYCKLDGYLPIIEEITEENSNLTSSQVAWYAEINTFRSGTDPIRRDKSGNLLHSGRVRARDLGDASRLVNELHP